MLCESPGVLRGLGVQTSAGDLPVQGPRVEASAGVLPAQHEGT